MERCSSIELTPLRELVMSQSAGSHLSRPSGESSRIVPALTLNRFLHDRLFHGFRVDRYECCFPPHLGQSGPSGHRRSARWRTHVAESEKERIASGSVEGSHCALDSPTTLFYPEMPGEASI
jgi:hypothetical protein